MSEPLGHGLTRSTLSKVRCALVELDAWRTAKTIAAEAGISYTTALVYLPHMVRREEAMLLTIPTAHGPTNYYRAIQ
jgi:response regulator of citrate/malate metabolism